eukprot:4593367-Pleurochrysis_carterae.AAC.3
MSWTAHGQSHRNLRLLAPNCDVGSFSPNAHIRKRELRLDGNYLRVRQSLEAPKRSFPLPQQPSIVGTDRTDNVEGSDSGDTLDRATAGSRGPISPPPPPPFSH